MHFHRRQRRIALETGVYTGSTTVAASTAVAFVAVAAIISGADRAVAGGYRVSVADCVKYGSCSDIDSPVLGGHDVVEAFRRPEDDKSEPIMGNDDHQVEFQGYQFWFRNEANRAEFERNTTRYVPRCGGFCAYGVACHGGHGVCTNNGAVHINGSAGWHVFRGRLYLFNHGARQHMMDNGSLFELAEKNWQMWYPENNRFNTDAFWPYKDADGESNCRTCGFDEGSSEANKMARNRKFFLGRSGAVTGMSPHHVHEFPKAVHSFHRDRGFVPPMLRSGIPGVR